MNDAEAHATMKTMHEKLTASIEEDERFLDEALRRFPDARGTQAADLRERIAESRMLAARMERALVHAEKTHPWLQGDTPRRKT